MTHDSDLAALTGTVTYLTDRQDILDVIVRESCERDRLDVEMVAGCD